jgi:hypothetical protein
MVMNYESGAKRHEYGKYGQLYLVLSNYIDNLELPFTHDFEGAEHRLHKVNEQEVEAVNSKLEYRYIEKPDAITINVEDRAFNFGEYIEYSDGSSQRKNPWGDIIYTVSFYIGPIAIQYTLIVWFGEFEETTIDKRVCSALAADYSDLLPETQFINALIGASSEEKAAIVRELILPAEDGLAQSTELNQVSDEEYAELLKVIEALGNAQ